MPRSLPSHPSLEHLSKEAKSLLKKQKTGERSVCDTLRLLRRFSEHPDQEVLDARVTLAEAQYALAMEYGFASWAALKAHVLEQAINKTPNVHSALPTGEGLFDEKVAWGAIEAAVADVSQLPEKVRSQILGIVIAGSLVRGDFLPNRSGVHVYTVLSSEAGQAWVSEAHQAVRECFDRRFRPYRGLSRNPYVWDDVTIGEGTLPKMPGESGRSRFRSLGIFYFDTLRFHRTVWGRDFTESMPPPANPKPLVLDRINFTIQRIDEAEGAGRADLARIPLAVESAVVLLQLYFAEELTLNKFRVLPQYEEYVSDFPEKPFGSAAWENYLSGSIGPITTLPHPFEEYYQFLLAARKLIRRLPREANGNT